ncbi:protease modulator HflK [Luteolibacter sp. LG18]|uniref:protease modulator HflK n=1 Tax=Luteolibacter sp. LG18 TaxID=2819286 RepID=UPI002B2D81F6|nr:hypothetical protein llg_27470 [Luteolibacter sp. LG18]
MNRRQRSRADGGQALFNAFASTIRVLRWLLGGLAVFYLCSGITRVAPNEDALIYRLGRLQPEVHPPGLLFALPEPIDRVVRVSSRTQHELFLRAWAPDEDRAVLSGGVVVGPSAETGNAGGPVITGNAVGAAMSADQAAAADFPKPPGPGLHPYHHGYTVTGDVNLVQARLIARYRISDPIAWVSAAPEAEMGKLVESLIFDAATRTLAGMNVDDALGNGLEQFRSQVLALAQRSFDRLRLGVTLVAFEVNTLTPPEATVAAFAEVTSARVESSTLLENARTYRARVLPLARSDAYRIRSEADAEARRLVTRAAAEAGSFTALEQRHRESPEVLETRLRAETTEAVFSQIKTSTVLPDDRGTIDLYLPANP